MKTTPFLAVWAWPIGLAVVSAVGLVSGLCGDGGWDGLAWTGLGLPAAAACWLGLRGGASRSGGSRPERPDLRR